MGIYAIYLNEPNEKVWNSLKKEYSGRNFILNKNMAFVAPDEDIILTSEIADALGMEFVPGMVLEIEAYNGYNKSELWEWFAKVQT